MDKIEVTMEQGNDGPAWVNCNVKLNGKLLDNVTSLMVTQVVDKPAVVTMEFTVPEVGMNYVTYVESKHQPFNWRKRYNEISNMGP